MRAKPRRFAEGTAVDVTKSRMEVEQLLAKHGAAQVLIGSDSVTRQGFVGFTLEGRQYRMLVPARDAKKGHEQQVDRERWRALVLILKAKLEVVASEMVTVEQEFLAYMVLPNGKTVGVEVAPMLSAAYDGGSMPNLLPEWRETLR
jgi:hypothetical protein